MNNLTDQMMFTKAQTQVRLEQLQTLLFELDSVVVAFSGGVDSTFLLSVAVEILGDKVLAVTASSETYSLEELEFARNITRTLRVRHIVVETSELDIPEFSSNPADRCFYCKRELYSRLNIIAVREGLRWVVDGAQADDLGDHRPGHRAAHDLGVRSPLMEVGLGKDEIRELSRSRGLSSWERPAMACLASRFPYGQEITAQKLAQVAAGEQTLYKLGIKQVRLRHHGNTARIEVTAKDIHLLVTDPTRSEVVTALKALGFTYITVDLQGYRQGSMNEVLTSEA